MTHTLVVIGWLADQPKPQNTFNYQQETDPAVDFAVKMGRTGERPWVPFLGGVPTSLAEAQRKDPPKR